VPGLRGSSKPYSAAPPDLRAADRRTGDEQARGKAATRERREAYVRGHQLAEMRTTAGVTQAELAEALCVSRARIPRSSTARFPASTSCAPTSPLSAEA
jgi:DNA-binding transcriptional regulator YiaG